MFKGKIQTAQFSAALDRAAASKADRQRRQNGPRHKLAAVDEISFRTLTGFLGIEVSNIDYASKKNRAHPQKTSTAKSILDSVDSVKVTKTSKSKRKSRRRMSISGNISRTAEKTIVDFKTVDYKSDAAASVKDELMRARLRLIHPSCLTKPAVKRLIGRQKDTTRLPSMRERHR